MPLLLDETIQKRGRCHPPRRVGLLSGFAQHRSDRSKATNLPLLLPWAIAVCALLPLLLRRPVATLLMGLLAAVVSCLPTVALNVRYCGDWSGAVLEGAGMDMKSPIVGFWGNSLLLLLKNFVPPFFPMASWWNQQALSVLPHGLVASFRSTLDVAVQADLLLIVVDASHPRVQDHLDVCQATLAEIGAGQVPALLVLNKCDLPGATETVAHAAERHPQALPVSARSGLGLDTLRLAIVEELKRCCTLWQLPSATSGT